MLHDNSSTEFGAISPMLEMGAYEWLWQQEQQGERKVSFKVLAELFRDHPGHWPSELVSSADAQACAEEVLARLRKRGVKSFSVRMQGAGDYPEGLKDAEHPLQFLYYRGDWDLAYSPKRVAVVGTRNPSAEGLRRTSKLVSLLVKQGVTIVSGLAKGVDTMAHQTAIERGGDTIAVIGTPIDQAYPKENAELQERIARDFLLISQVPVLLYARRPPSVNRLFFPERNITMSALTQATVIVEAGETSGTLIQARAAFKQGRKGRSAQRDAKSRLRRADAATSPASPTSVVSPPFALRREALLARREAAAAASDALIPPLPSSTAAPSTGCPARTA